MIQVIVMCKAPVVGRVKTRLIGEGIDADKACDWHRQMAQAVIWRAAETFPDQVAIAVDDPSHPFFTQFHLPLLAQGEGDLGERLIRLAQPRLEYASVLFLGTDSPHMTVSRLREAAELTARYAVVAGPVEDGGYDLVLLSNPGSLKILDGIDWGSDRVWAQTRERAGDAGLSLAALSTGFDVDTAEDLHRSLLLGWN